MDSESVFYQWYWWNQLKKNANNLGELFKEQSEEKVQRILIRRTTIQNMKAFLEGLHRLDLLKSSKSQLSTPILGTPKAKNILISSMMHEEDGKIKRVAEKLINTLTNIEDYSVREIKQNIFVYLQIFNRWKGDDREKMLTELGSAHLELKITVDNTENVSLKRQGEEQIKKLLKLASDIGGDEGVKFVQEYSEPVVMATWDQGMLDVARKAFWDVIKEDLEEDPPKMDHINVLFEEVEMHMNSLLPEKYIEEFLGDFMDDHILNMIGHKLFRKHDFLPWAEKLIGWVKKVGFADKDEEADKKFAEIKELVETKKPTDCIPVLFTWCLDTLMSIENWIIEQRDSVNNEEENEDDDDEEEVIEVELVVGDNNNNSDDDDSDEN